MKKILLFTGFMLLAGALLTGCKKDNKQSAAPQTAFFGTWKWGGSPFWSTVTIDTDKIVFINSEEYAYTLENLTWTPINNPSDDYSYPTGYKFTGKLTHVDHIILLKADGSGEAAVGDMACDWWYISTDKNSLSQGDWYSEYHHSTGDSYFKQP